MGRMGEGGLKVKKKHINTPKLSLKRQDKQTDGPQSIWGRQEGRARRNWGYSSWGVAGSQAFFTLLRTE